MLGVMLVLLMLSGAGMTKEPGRFFDVFFNVDMIDGKLQVKAENSITGEDAPVTIHNALRYARDQGAIIVAIIAVELDAGRKAQSRGVEISASCSVDGCVITGLRPGGDFNDGGAAN